MNDTALLEPTDTALAEEPMDTDEPTPDLDLLREVLAVIDTHPEQFDQRYWVGERYSYVSDPLHLVMSDIREHWRSNVGVSEVDCKTTRCVAGWAQLLVDGKTTNRAPWRAQALLGLTDEEAYDLFYRTARVSIRQQRSAVQRVCERIAARAGERL